MPPDPKIAKGGKPRVGCKARKRMISARGGRRKNQTGRPRGKSLDSALARATSSGQTRDGKRDEAVVKANTILDDNLEALIERACTLALRKTGVPAAVQARLILGLLDKRLPSVQRTDMEIGGDAVAGALMLRLTEIANKSARK